MQLQPDRYARARAVGGQLHRASSGEESPPPPSTRVYTVVNTIHGEEIPDDFRWLKDQDSPETHSWLEPENAYTLSALADRPKRPSIERLLEEQLRIDRVGAPMKRGKRYSI